METSDVILRGRRSTLDVSCCMFFADRIVSAAQSGDKVQIPWRALHFVTFDEKPTEATLYTLHFTLYTPHFALYTLYSTLHTPHPTPTPHTLHFTLHTLHSTLHTLHFMLYTSHFTLHTLHFTLHTLHCTLCTPHFTLPFTSLIAMIPGFVIIRVSIRVRGRHLVFFPIENCVYV